MDNRFSVEELRSKFPALKKRVEGRPVIYFDGPAGTQVPQVVVDAIADSLFNKNANKGGVFHTSIESDAGLRHATQAVADFVGSDNPAEVVFGQNMTSLTYQLSRSLARTWNPGDEIVLTRLDHDANITPWQQAAEEVGAIVRFVPFTTDDFTLDMEAMDSLINERTRLVAVGGASNATGGINPVQRIAAMAKQVGALTFVDAVHFGPHDLIDVQAWGCDFLSCSAYKFFGPHLGILWGKQELLESLPAYQVRPASQTSPGRWMTGTQSHESIMGTMACIDYLAEIGAKSQPQSDSRRKQIRASFSAIREYETGLSQRLLEGLRSIEGVRVYGITDADRLLERVATFSFTHDRVPTRDIARELADVHIQVWNGNYYALQFTETLGLEPAGMVRIGLVHYNTAEEVDQLLNRLSEIVNRATVTV